MFKTNMNIVPLAIVGFVLQTVCCWVTDYPVPTFRVEQCRDGCHKKFSLDDIDCLQAPQCSLCWDDCATSTSINKPILDTWTLRVTSMVRESSLVSANIAWDAEKTPSECLVSWEVSGGGLVGNLLTQSANVELSLWPDIKYRLQVTCKNKQTDEISRSLPMTLDTSQAVVVIANSPSAVSPIDLANTPKINTILSTSHSLNDKTKQQPHLQPLDFRGGVEMLSSFGHKPSTNKANNFAKMYNYNKEFILGLLTALSVFFIVIVLFVVGRRKSRPTDKVPLVVNEDSVYVDVERLTIHV